MLDAIVAVVVVLLIAAAVLVMVGPGSVIRRIRAVRRPTRIRALFEPGRPREVVPPALNQKTQRVLVAAARLANWLRAHGHEEVACGPGRSRDGSAPEAKRGNRMDREPSVPVITSEEHLRALVGDPVPRVALKARRVLDECDREWLARSRFCMIASRLRGLRLKPSAYALS